MFRSTQAMKVYLIRHGRTADAEANISQRNDSGLSESGRAQVVELKPEFAKIPFTKIYHSPWQRAKETTDLLFGDSGLPVKELAYIHEMKKPPYLEGIDYDLVKKFWDENEKNLYDPDWTDLGGESFNEVLARVKKLKQFILKHKEDEVLGIVSHGNFLRFLVSSWLLAEAFTPYVLVHLLRHLRIHNAGYILIDVDRDKESIKVRKWHSWE